MQGLVKKNCQKKDYLFLQNINIPSLKLNANLYMLKNGQKCLIAKMRGKARKENVLFWKDYRVTVLSARLFRLEKSPEGIFRDCATQAVWFRDFADFAVP